MKFCWSTISVKNLEESVKFYEEIVGLNVVNRFPAGPDSEIAFLGDGETKIELIWNKNKTDINIGQDISWGFTVDSVDEKINFLKEKGIDILEGPFQPTPQSKFFFILDPNGLRIQFYEEVNG
ncbi:MAG: VOC family protein [Tissierella sp.]|nr:VOC family protein [Tissierella sp.]